MTFISQLCYIVLVQILTTILVINLVEAAPVTSLTTNAPATPATTTSEVLAAASATTTSDYLVIDWQPTATTNLSPTVSATQIDPLLLNPGSATTTITRLATAVSTSWSAASTFSDMSSFSVSAYAAGASNLAILRGSPITSNTSSSTGASQSAASIHDFWDDSINSLQVFYPNGSINPGNSPQGGAEFYARPLDITRAVNASLEYSVYFPADFDFVKGGKLPGLYGGHKGCSGGNAAVDCFSTRMMWRAGGKGELYLYAPKDDQTPSLCATPPQSVCDSAYGLSIGRGSWTFAPGNWTTIRQDVWLNTPGQDDGGINVWINGRLAMSANDIRYRENANTCLNPLNADEELSDEAVASDLSPSPYMDEDWQPMLSSSTSIGAWPGTSISSTSEVPPSSMTALHVKQGLSAARAASAAPLALTGGSVQSVAAAASSAENTCNVGFIGLFFSTFFGGHTDDWASPKDQYSYFKDFSMWINS